MKVLHGTLGFAVLLTFLVTVSRGQIISGGTQKPAKPRENFEHIDCGIRFALPGKHTKSTSIGYSPYRELGDGEIDHFNSSLATYDIGCINLDDPPRTLKRDALISSLNSMTNSYLQGSFAFEPVSSPTVKDQEIYHFETKTDFIRLVRYVLQGNRVSILLASPYDERGREEALKVFESVKFFSIQDSAEERIELANGRSLPQSPALKLTQSDAAQYYLKGRVRSVRMEEEDVPILVGPGERRLLTYDTYDRDGNLVKSYWFQDAGYPTSVTTYGYINGMRVSDSEDIDYDTTSRITISGQNNASLPPPDTRYKNRYEYIFDASNGLTQSKEYDNRGTLRRIVSISYTLGFREEKTTDPGGKLISTKRWHLDKKGNAVKYEFWWYNDTDKEIESYDHKKFDRFGNWTERRVVKTIIDRGLTRTRTSDQFRTIVYF